jgi:Putative DNA-binding domain
MPSLRELQQRAYRAIVLEEDGGFAPMLRDPCAAPARLAVYRNNASETFLKTLAATYPVVQRLVGELCFRGLAHAYRLEFASRSGDLARYGEELPTLLEIYYRDTGVAYLADVARLEWACAEAETAADGVPFDLLHLAAVPGDDCARLRFTLRAPVRLLSSRYPVFSIWEANQADAVRLIALSRGAEHVLVTRGRGGVRAYGLDAGTFAFARSLADGESLEDAACAGEAAGAGFAVDAALKTLAQLDVLAGFRLPADEVE